ncbi:putative bifunctional diguanylate cyclase/phosphodiesterase [Noviherbaspirillum pedocola]|uniref:EAL domain-containing protein n=1 Tax=Noviherbaspirillum pedocola TaxID=2801341 RepID=A0A934W555_9BURK|nr:EAL domain-containing protein [Noviherbaspirillum pedocola]MBK4733525.1 EAL domain-containing protein [Noviherbaspirillum pedocola]
MVLTSLQRRIAVVFVGLLVLVMGLILALVHTSSKGIVSSEARRELAVGTKVFRKLLEQNQRQLETAATVLSADFAFREAIATQDQPTMRSVIRNHGNRIHAQVMMVANPEGSLLATTQRESATGAPFPFPDLLAAAESAGKSAGFRQMRNGQLYQVVVVPIMAPQRIAWVAMGFHVDSRWAQDLAEVTGLAVHVVRNDAGQPALLASSTPENSTAGMEQALRSGSELQQIGRALYQIAQVPLGGDIEAVLELPVAQVQAPFDFLQGTLLIVVGAGILVFALGSAMLARRIVKPLNALSTAARRVAMGDYAQPLPSLPPDEIGQLAASFEHMREGIASREERIIRLAYVDNLTELANRTSFEEAFAQLPAGSSGAIAVLNIHRFALINNALGYPIGDRLLHALGARLSQLLTPDDMLARLWGDQFAFLLRHADSDAARTFASAVLATLIDPLTLDGQRLDMGGSIGIARYPQDGSDAGTVLRRAELAMTEAKRRHCGIAFAADIGTGPAHEQLSLIGEMREAMANGEFVVFYQPKLALRSGRIVAAEALLRWNHPERGMIAPSRFIPFAEQTGFIREITPWLLDAVIQQLALWQGAGLDIAVSANLSALDLLDAGLSGRVSGLLKRHGVAAERLCLEITESALMDDPALALEHLAELAALGIKLSIDDYGVGQASLTYLKSLPVNELKLDRSFITAIAESPKDSAIVLSTIMLSHALGLSVVAEGVETPADLHWLMEHGCDIAQGYGIARPMPAQQLPGWIASYSAEAVLASTS